jgi:hypothetical protein
MATVMPLRGCVRYFLGKAKDIILRPISSQEANALIKRVHYSGKVVNNSQFHIGVYYQSKLEGAMQFGPSLDKRKIQPLVSGTLWNEFIELNRMAFSEALPRNSESRALGIAMRMLRKHAPHLQWVISFADGAQCGDGTIYRAAGFVLTGIKENNQIWAAPDGEVTTRMVATDTRRLERGRLSPTVARADEAGTRESRTSLTDGRSKTQQAHARALSRVSATKGTNILETGGASMKVFIEAGFKPIPGYQLRYIYFLDPTARVRLTVPELPYSEIERRGASMYRGISRAASIDSDAAGLQPAEEGAVPIAALQTEV